MEKQNMDQLLRSLRKEIDDLREQVPFIANLSPSLSASFSKKLPSPPVVDEDSHNNHKLKNQDDPSYPPHAEAAENCSSYEEFNHNPPLQQKVSFVSNRKNWKSCLTNFFHHFCSSWKLYLFWWVTCLCLFWIFPPSFLSPFHYRSWFLFSTLFFIFSLCFHCLGMIWFSS